MNFNPSDKDDTSKYTVTLGENNRKKSEGGEQNFTVTFLERHKQFVDDGNILQIVPI